MCASDVTGVTRDGHDEPYTTESIDNGVRVKIGDKDVTLDDGPHVYKLTYITARQIGFFPKYDELYWNVTGNGWAFHMDEASATIHLPAGAKDHPEHGLYRPGRLDRPQRHGHAARARCDPLHDKPGAGAERGADHRGRILQGRRGAPSDAELQREFILDNASPVVALLGVFALAIFYLVTWWHHGRDRSAARSSRCSRRPPACRRNRCATSTAWPMTANPSPRR